MKKYFVLVASVLMMSCASDYEEFINEPQEDTELAYYLDRAIYVAYDTHLWMSYEEMCEEYDCCWEYVDEFLRTKYENGDKLTIEEKQAIIKGIMSSPSFLDTLDEGDEFYNLHCYMKYGHEYFETYIDEEE